jgi:hypothetical protein
MPPNCQNGHSEFCSPEHNKNIRNQDNSTPRPVPVERKHHK